MTTPLVLTAGPFDIVEMCYVPGCDREADLQDCGGPICRRCSLKKTIAIVVGDLYTYESAGWAPARTIENSRKSVMRCERELAELEPGVPSKLPLIAKFEEKFNRLQLERPN